MNTSNIPMEALISFTFDQCFNYYNWEGAVKVPACVQCATKLSKLITYTKETIVPN
jgi:aubergine-like protein